MRPRQVSEDDLSKRSRLSCKRMGMSSAWLKKCGCRSMGICSITTRCSAGRSMKNRTLQRGCGGSVQGFTRKCGVRIMVSNIGFLSKLGAAIKQQHGIGFSTVLIRVRPFQSVTLQMRNSQIPSLNMCIERQELRTMPQSLPIRRRWKRCSLMQSRWLKF